MTPLERIADAIEGKDMPLFSGAGVAPGARLQRARGAVEAMRALPDDVFKAGALALGRRPPQGSHPVRQMWNAMLDKMLEG